MATLKVQSTTDFSGQVLSNIGLIDYSSTTGSATATFLSSQFDDIQIRDEIVINGGANADRLVVNVDPAFGHYLNITFWNFTNWDADDNIILVGSSGADDIRGLAFRSVIIRGGGGDDSISGSGKADSLSGGAGNDTIFTDGKDFIDGGVGTKDLLWLQASDAVGLSIDMSAAGGSGDIGDGTHFKNIEIIHLDGGSRSDTVTGGRFGEWISGGGGNDQIDGAGGDDILSCGSGKSRLNGGAGDDTLQGRGSDTLRGGNGDDQIGCLVGHTTINGGTGTDNAGINRISSSLNFTIDIRLGGGGANIGDGTTITNVETIEFQGGSGDDVITGGAFDDYFFGGSGNDRFNGGGGNDDFDGSDGNDILSGGAGDDLFTVGYGNAGPDRVDGGSGTDTLRFYCSSNAFSADLIIDISAGGGGADIGDGTTLTSIERIDFRGGLGDDKVTGGNLDDVLSGYDGANVLVGGAGDDMISGGGDKDTITGGTGHDFMSGGFGKDTFVYTSATESVMGAARDEIGDFEHRVDRINLAKIDAIAGGVDNSFKLIGNAAFSHTAGELRFVQNSTQTIISGDITGDGIADFQIELTGVIALTGVDFVL